MIGMLYSADAVEIRIAAQRFAKLILRADGLVSIATHIIESAQEPAFKNRHLARSP